MSATLKGTIREKLGSRSARVLCLQNQIPCCVQGEGADNINFSIDADELGTARRHHEHLFDIEFDKGDAETGMVRELHWDALGTVLLHVEFVRVVRGRKTEVEVELEFAGNPKGGVLNALHTHIAVSCLPSEIPDGIEVLVDDLEQGHPLTAGDVKLPKGVELAIPAETQIAVAVTVRADEAEVEDELEGDEGLDVPAGEGDDKPEDS
jgi:large subunit ribosomal protein L25